MKIKSSHKIYQLHYYAKVILNLNIQINKSKKEL